MDEIKKEVAELKVLVSKLLEIQIAKYNLEYGYMKPNQIVMEKTDKKDFIDRLIEEASNKK